MKKISLKTLTSFCVCAGLLLLVQPVMAMDSYRYMHVTIETPWAIFLFLLPIVLFPLILMVILYWRFAGRRHQLESSGSGD